MLKDLEPPRIGERLGDALELLRVHSLPHLLEAVRYIDNHLIVPRKSGEVSICRGATPRRNC
jgi:hypothetical protein